MSWAHGQPAPRVLNATRQWANIFLTSSFTCPLKAILMTTLDQCLCQLFLWKLNEERVFGDSMKKPIRFQMLSYTHIAYFIQVLQYSVAIHTLKRNPTASKIDIKYKSINFTGNTGESLVLLSKIITQILMKICQSCAYIANVCEVLLQKWFGN